MVVVVVVLPAPMLIPLPPACRAAVADAIGSGSTVSPTMPEVAAAPAKDGGCRSHRVARCRTWVAETGNARISFKYFQASSGRGAWRRRGGAAATIGV